jgi:uncharacterized glyoxalase superfamily protein PhnB
LPCATVEGALTFYRDGLGLDTQGVIGSEFEGDEVHPAGAIAMFQLHGGVILALYPRSELAKDANIPPAPPASGNFSIGHAVASKADVDALLAQADHAGAVLTAKAHDRPWGIYSGYFQDLDGHLWEIMWNPQLETDGAAPDRAWLDDDVSPRRASVRNAAQCLRVGEREPRTVARDGG